MEGRLVALVCWTWLRIILALNKSWKSKCLVYHTIFIFLHISSTFLFGFFSIFFGPDDVHSSENLQHISMMRYGELYILFPVIASLTGIIFPVVFCNQVVLAVGFCFMFGTNGDWIGICTYLFDCVLLFGVTYGFLWNSKMQFLNAYSFKMEMKLANKVQLQQAIVEQKGRYIAQVAHDIGTPLATFALAIDLLKEIATSKEQEDILETAKSAVELMTITRQEALDHAKNVEGLPLQTKIVKVDLSQVLKKCERVMMGYGGAANLPINYFLDHQLRKRLFTDPDMLWNMLVNYLSNARKYSARGHITAVVYEVAKGCVRVEVIDEGIGVKDEAQKKKLFKPFGQLMTGTAGTGLGLNGVLLKAKALGGRVGMRDSPFSRSGSVFWFEFPYTDFDDTQLLESLPEEPAFNEGLLIIGNCLTLRQPNVQNFYEAHFAAVDFAENHEEVCNNAAFYKGRNYRMVMWQLEEQCWDLSESQITDLMLKTQESWSGRENGKRKRAMVTILCDFTKPNCRQMTEPDQTFSRNFLSTPFEGTSSASFQKADKDSGEEKTSRSLLNNGSVLRNLLNVCAKNGNNEKISPHPSPEEKEKTIKKPQNIVQMIFPELLRPFSLPECSSISSDHEGLQGPHRRFFDFAAKGRYKPTTNPVLASSAASLIELSQVQPQRSLITGELNALDKIKKAAKTVGFDRFIQRSFCENDVMCLACMLKENRVGNENSSYTASEILSFNETAEANAESFDESKATDTPVTSARNGAQDLSASLNKSTLSEDSCSGFGEPGCLAERILLVDDDKTILKFMKQMLQRTTAFHVVSKTNGYDGLLALQENYYYAALVDLMMPVMDGMECLRRFRQWEEAELQKNRRTQRQLVIIVSANSHSSHQEMAFDAGADDFISKPVRFPDLVEKIAALKKKTSVRKKSEIKRLSLGESLRLSFDGSPLSKTENQGNEEQKCLLLADDNLSILKLTKKKLENCGYVVQTASNGEQALQIMCTTNFHAVLLDNQMPIMDGLECLERFRQWERDKLAALVEEASNDESETKSHKIKLIPKRQKIILLSGEDLSKVCPQIVVDNVEACLLKSDDFQKLLDAIEA